MKLLRDKYFTNVIGYDAVKSELFQFCDMILHPDIYNKLNVKIPHGIFFYGAPGCGKTMIASELANICADKVYYIDGAQEDSDLCNEILDVLKEASDIKTRFVVLIDNIDRFYTRDENSPVYYLLGDIMKTFIETDSGKCFFIATSGGIEHIPYCLLRKNTFEYIVHIGLPTYSDTKQIVKYYAEKYPIASDVNLDDIDKLFFNNSCEYITDVFNTAAITVCRDRRCEITTDDFVRAHIFEQDHAVLALTPNEMSAWHEAGHLVVCELMEPGCVCIACVASGNSFGGVCSRWKTLPVNQLVVSALAGKTACEMQFGKFCDGFVSDINKARDYIFDAIYQDGSYGFLGFKATSENHDSECTILERESIVRSELQRNLIMTQRMLAQNREFLEKVANALMKKSYLLHTDIEEIKETCTIHPIEGV